MDSPISLTSIHQHHFHLNQLYQIEDSIDLVEKNIRNAPSVNFLGKHFGWVNTAIDVPKTKAIALTAQRSLRLFVADFTPNIKPRHVTVNQAAIYLSEAARINHKIVAITESLSKNETDYTRPAEVGLDKSIEDSENLEKALAAYIQDREKCLIAEFKKPPLYIDNPGNLNFYPFYMIVMELFDRSPNLSAAQKTTLMIPMNTRMNGLLELYDELSYKHAASLTIPGLTDIYSVQWHFEDYLKRNPHLPGIDLLKKEMNETIEQLMRKPSQNVLRDKEKTDLGEFDLI